MGPVGEAAGDFVVSWVRKEDSRGLSNSVLGAPTPLHAKVAALLRVEVYVQYNACDG